MILAQGKSLVTHKLEKIALTDGIVGQLCGIRKYLITASLSEVRLRHPKYPTAMLIVKLETVKEAA